MGEVNEKAAKIIAAQLPAPAAPGTRSATQPAATQPATQSTTESAAATPEAARVELRAIFAKAIAESAAMTEELQQQAKLVRDVPPGLPSETRPRRQSALPSIGEESGKSKRITRSDALEDLTERLNKDSRRQMTPELRAYAAAAGEILSDPDPAFRGMACVFLGLIGPHTVEAGLLPNLAARLSDTDAAIKALQDQPVPQSTRSLLPPPTSTPLTVGELAQMGLTGATNLRFMDPVTFQEWWQANRVYESCLWYWSLRWGRQGGPERDLPRLFARDPQAALPILMLAASYNCLEREARPTVARSAPVGRTETSTGPFCLFRAAQAGQRGGANNAVTTSARHCWRWLWVISPGRTRCRTLTAKDVALTRVIPVLAAASTKADAPEIRGLLEASKGLAGTSAKIQVALMRVAAALDPENAVKVMLEQLGRNPALPSLAADLVARTGVEHWDVIKGSYTHTPGGDEEGVKALIAAVAALKPGEARQTPGGTPGHRPLGSDVDQRRPAHG